MGLASVFNYLFHCSTVIPLVPLCFYPVQGYIKSRMSVLIMKIVLALTGIVWLVALVGYFVFPLPNDINWIIGIIGIYSFYFYNKEVRLSFAKKLFVFLSACLVGGFSMVYATVADYILHPEGNFLNFSTEAVIVQLLFLAAADMALYLPLSKYMGWVIANFHEEAVWKRVCMFPALFLVAVFCMFPRRYSIMQAGNLKGFYPFILLFFTFFVILIYFMFYVIAFTYVQKQKTEIANQVLMVQGSQYQQLLRTVEENSRIRHDFRHQLIVISRFVEQKEYDKLEEYVHNYIDDIQAEVKIYSYSAAVNALISYYEAVCLGKKIRTEFVVSLPKRLSVSDQDFCVMLGNLLENAIDGAGETDDPYISLKIRQTASNMLAVKVANPCQGEITKEGGRYRSSKREGYGQGLESVDVIVNKYQGVMEILTDPQTFTVKILLQISDGEVV